jgi:hypothetical protein
MESILYDMPMIYISEHANSALAMFIRKNERVGINFNRSEAIITLVHMQEDDKP